MTKGSGGFIYSLKAGHDRMSSWFCVRVPSRLSPPRQREAEGTAKQRRPYSIFDMRMSRHFSGLLGLARHGMELQARYVEKSIHLFVHKRAFHRPHLSSVNVLGTLSDCFSRLWLTTRTRVTALPEEAPQWCNPMILSLSGISQLTFLRNGFSMSMTMSRQVSQPSRKQ